MPGNRKQPVPRPQIAVEHDPRRREWAQIGEDLDAPAFSP
jgi:hypothetical protein